MAIGDLFKSSSMKKSKGNRCQCCNETLAAAFHSVFGKEGKAQGIAALLNDYIGKSLNDTNGVEYFICDPCWQQLIQYNDFKQKCIRANQFSSGDEEEEETDRNNKNVNHNETFIEYQNEISTSECTYEDSEYLDESQNGSDFDTEMMNVEYLEDTSDAEIYPNLETAKKKISFDFTSVLVKPIIGK